MPVLIYLHGFLSSPQSKKAQETEQWLRRYRPDIKYLCPRLSSYPAQAKETLDALIRKLTAINDSTKNDAQIGLVGSSLGGFWATYLMEQGGQLTGDAAEFRAVLVNPAVSPHTRFKHFLNTPLKSYYSDEVYCLTEEDKKLLESLDHTQLTAPHNYTVLLQTGDETLDYRFAEQRYQECNLLIEQGGNHSFEGYQEHLEDIVNFLFA